MYRNIMPISNFSHWILSLNIGILVLIYDSENIKCFQMYQNLNMNHFSDFVVDTVACHPDLPLGIKYISPGTITSAFADHNDLIRNSSAQKRCLIQGYTLSPGTANIQ